jgi:hypothetical protein
MVGFFQSIYGDDIHGVWKGDLSLGITVVNYFEMIARKH